MGDGKTARIVVDLNLTPPDLVDLDIYLIMMESV